MRITTRVNNFVDRRITLLLSLHSLKASVLGNILENFGGTRAGGYGCGRNLGVSSSYVRYLRSVTGHLLNRQREREQEEHRGRRRKEARETGAKRRG